MRCVLYPMTIILLFIGLNQSLQAGSIPKVAKKDQICFAMYTVHRNTLKMTVQCYPLADNDSRSLTLSIKKEGRWKVVATEKVRENSYQHGKNKAWNLLFRVEHWDHSKDWEYRVTALNGVASYSGVIRKDPSIKDEIVVAAFTGNHHSDKSLREDISRNMKNIDPDLLFFSGDQMYDHTNHLGGWLLFGRQFGDIIKDRPTVCIPDDHDVGQWNLWGAGGKKSNNGLAAADGGYHMPAAYVKEAEFAQTANLPDPYDPTPVKQGIGVYYTSLNVGGIDFAIIEDRKFKTGPLGLVKTPGNKRPDLIGDPNYDRKVIDHPDAVLLGERQLKFLNDWSSSWKGSSMKCVLSATVFAQACTKSGKDQVIGDLDSNGWPQTGRNKALKAIRKSFAFMLAGDLHLPNVIHHGVDDWGDAGYAFCVPSIVTGFKRSWLPSRQPKIRMESPLIHTGTYFDGFNNKITMHAYANPESRKEKYGKQDKNSSGFGIVRFNKKKRTIRMECWPRNCDVTNPRHKQFTGWPITIKQTDNYAKKASAWLPTINCKTMTNPVIQVVNEATKETVYSLRIVGKSYTPKVFENGTYTIRVGGHGAGSLKVFEKVKSLKNITNTDMIVVE